LLSHVLVVGLLIVTANLGFWQLRRLDARRDYNAVVAARADEPVVDLATAFGALKRGGTPEDLRHMRVAVSGTWADGQVYLANRSMDGVPGVHVVSLLLIDRIHPNLGVVVDRGFVHRGLFLEGDSAAWAPATADVDLVGSLDVSRTGELGSGAEVDRIDLDALAERWGTNLAPMWIRSAADGPSGIPVAAPVEDLGAGSHFSYAVQWFVFTLIGLGGYPLVLVRLARRDPALA
jgi:cytochrome oxidase assembly protein ShyY1|tara:strand:- start:2096 stop:2797 length:702 start_codon:yes stop_codon:yes gene_type:complete